MPHPNNSRTNYTKSVFITHYAALAIMAILLSTCGRTNNNKENLIVKKSSVIIHKNGAENITDDGEEWLKRIFKNNNSEKYFPDYNVEERLCTKRYQEFINECEAIYGVTNLTRAELDSAEIKLKLKWTDIYPIEEKEMWLFGRGNGDIGELKELKIHKIADLKYKVFIDYGNQIKTINTVTLVPENGTFKIDYCWTEFIH